jgi:hypothetical protein
MCGKNCKKDFDKASGCCSDKKGCCEPKKDADKAPANDDKAAPQKKCAGDCGCAPKKP